MNPEKTEDPIVPLVPYNPSKKLNMEGLFLGEAPPESYAENLEVGVNTAGDQVFYVSGGRIFQGEHELLKPGDRLERLKTRFETCKLEGPFLLLDKQIILVLEHDEEFIQNITLVSSPYKKGHTIDGVWLGMSPGLAEYLTRSPESKTQLFYSFRGVGGVLGTSLKVSSDGQEFHQGQTLDPLPEKSASYYAGPPSFFVFLDERGAVDQFGMGTFSRAVLGATLVPPDLAAQFDLKLLTQTCVEVDRNRRPTAFEEKWRMPGHQLTITGGTTLSRNTNLLERELPHSLLDDELSASEWSIGQRSHWQVNERPTFRTCTFLHQGQYFNISASTDYGVPLIEGEIIEKIGRAIVAAREGQ